MVVRELIALFGFEVDKKSAATVDEKVSGLFNKVKGLAAVAGAVVVGTLLKGVAEGVGQMADEVDTAAQRLGLAAQELQELRFAADRADVSNEELGTGLRTLARQAYEAANGNKEAADTFARLGVGLRDSRGQVKPVAQLLQESADGIKRLSSETDRTALAQRAFGRSGTALIPMLVKGSKALEEMRKRAHALGSVMDDDLLRVAGEWDDSTKDLRDGLQGLKNAIGRALLPVLTRLNKAWTALLVRHGDFIRSKLFKVVEGLGRAVGALMEVVVDATDAVLRWAGSLDPLASKFLAVGAAAAALAILLALPGGALLALILLIGLIIEDFYTWREGGKSVIGDLVRAMDELLAPFPVLRQALSAVGETFSVIFTTITNLIGSLVQLLVTVWDEPGEALSTFGEQMKTLFGGVVDFIIGRWQAVGEFISGALDSVLPKIQKVLDAGSKVASVLGFGGVAAAADVGARVVGAGASAVSGPSNTQTNNVQVSVNAAGATNPEAVGVAVARQMDMVLERQNRDAMAALTVAAP